MSLNHAGSVQRDGAPQLTGAPILPRQLIVHCIAERKGEYWQAFSLEFGLAAQADTFSEAKRRLDSMIGSYLHDALVGEDREFAEDLLSRKATWGVYAKYYRAAMLEKVAAVWGKSQDLTRFSEPVPMTVACVN
jgi:predicted RNase H-like HicB family nuclease